MNGISILSEVKSKKVNGRSILPFNFLLLACLPLCLCVSAVNVLSQDGLPNPGPEKSVSIPAVKEFKLKNGLTVVVVEKPGVPIVTAQLIVKNGAADETIKKAGLANITASMLTKGTKTRTAEQIAEEMEFLGGSINSGAGWNNSFVTIGITSDKLDQAIVIMADVVLNPSFKKEELDLLKAQSLDELKFSLTQPGFIANYAASVYSAGEHPAGGTPASIESFAPADISEFYSKRFTPDNAVLLFTGDITAAKGISLAESYFGKWPQPKISTKSGYGFDSGLPKDNSIVRRILVVDLPNSGQASVNYVKPIGGIGRGSKDYYAASVLNSLLGGGYSSRLNQEIRIKRGLSYGAGSGFQWRNGKSNFTTRTQTKNESAAEVAELVVAELKRLAETNASSAELTPRKLVLTGGFGQSLETTGGLAGALADLYTFGLPANTLNNYMANVTSVNESSVKDFAAKYLNNGDMIIVGDHAKFKDDLAKRFPNMKIDVIKIDDLNIESPTLRRSDLQ